MKKKYKLENTVLICYSKHVLFCILYSSYMPWCSSRSPGIVLKSVFLVRSSPKAFAADLKSILYTGMFTEKHTNT